MQNINGRPSGAGSSLGFALAEWSMVLPAAGILAAAAFRMLGGHGWPVQIAEMIVTSAGSHLGRPGAALLFLALPAAALVLGSIAVRREWRGNQALHEDCVAVAAALRRHLATAFLSLATLLAVSVLVFVAGHILTD